MIVPTVNLKRAQQTLVFYCQSAKNYGDVVGARDLVSPPATFAGHVKRGVGAQFMKGGNSFVQFATLSTERPALVLARKLSPVSCR